jgi:hypothetical protein
MERTKMWRTGGIAVIAAGLAIGAGLWVGRHGGSATAAERTLPPLTITTLKSQVSFPLVGIVLDPPPSGFQPALDGQTAAGMARDNLGLAAAPTAVTATLAAYSGEPVWNVLFDGLCQPQYGPESTNRCDSTGVYVMVDANDGHFIVQYDFGGS